MRFLLLGVSGCGRGQKPLRTICAIAAVTCFLLKLSGSPILGQDRPSANRQPAGDILIYRADGSRFWGVVDSRTSADQLWLRFSAGTAQVLRPFQWETITQATHEGKTVPLVDLPALAEKLQTTAKIPVRQTNILPAKVAAGPASLPPDAIVASAKALRSITCSARLANWNADAPSDGLLLEVVGLDSYGEPVLLSGVVEVQLLAPQRRRYDEAPQSRGWTLEKVESWNIPVANALPRGPGMLFRLPFGAVQPNVQTNWGNMGLLKVRLVVPGGGVFEQTLDPVTLRPWQPLTEGFLGSR